MKGVKSIWKMLAMALCCLPGILHAQVEENADVTTELVEDAFQEGFFEALKQKGIGNLDRALEYLIECKALEPEEHVVDYELGRIYTGLKQYQLAETHFSTAVKSAPQNFWYLNELVQLYLVQQNTDKAIATVEQYRDNSWEHQLLLVDLYIRNKEFSKAQEMLGALDLPSEAYPALAALKLRLIDKRTASKEVFGTDKEVVTEAPAEAGTVDQYKKELASLAGSRAYRELLEKSEEAVSNFPAQPEFYYFKGLALLKTGAAEQSLDTAQEGMAYLLDDNQLELAFYQLMKQAYEILGDEKKRKEIESKIGQKGF